MRKKREVDFDKVVTQIHEYYKILETEPGNSERNIVCSEAKFFEVLSQDMLDKVEKILQGMPLSSENYQFSIWNNKQQNLKKSPSYRKLIVWEVTYRASRG